MVRSVRVAPNCIEKVKSALVRNGFPTQGHLATELEIGLSTINKFFNGKSIYFSKCEDICHRLGLQWQEIIDLGNDDVTAVAPKIAENQSLEKYALIGLGQLYGDLQDYDKAIAYYQQGLAIARESKDYTNEAKIGYSLAEIYEQLGNYYQAVEYCNQTIYLATQLDIPLAKECQDLKERLLSQIP